MIHPAEDIYRFRQLVQNKLIDKYFNKDNTTLSFNTSIKWIRPTISKDYIFEYDDTYKLFEIRVPLNYTHWRQDPKNKIESPIVFKEQLSYKSFEQVGENKYVFELNRLHVLPILGYRYTKKTDDVTLTLIKKLTSSWIDENPFLHSINWKSGIEVGIRSVNIIVLRDLLQDSLGKDLDNKIDKLLGQSYYYLKNHLSLFSSGNNHLIGELLGLIIIGITSNFNHNQKEVEYFIGRYEEEILKLTNIDGGLKEQSTYYHATVLNSTFVVLHFINKINISPSKVFLERVMGMTLFLDIMTLGGEKDIHVGDKDDSNLIYDVFDKDFNLYTSLLYSGKRIFPRIKYKFFDENRIVNDFINHILYDELSFDIPNQEFTSIIDDENFLYLQKTGYFLFYKEEFKIYFDVGNLGFEPLSAHGHSDLLHFTIWYKGKPFIVDAGTYQYNPSMIFWRNYFRGITAHNTISINGENHSKALGSMMWGKTPTIRINNYGSDSKITYCEATHNGFSIGEHKRRIEVSRDKIALLDNVWVTKKSRLDFFLHFHPDFECEVVDNSLLVYNKNSRTLIAEIKNKYFNNAKIIKGDNNMPLGWYSDSYDFKIATNTLKLSLDFSNEIDLETVIQFI